MMKFKSLFVYLVLSALVSGICAQEIALESEHQFKSLKKDSYLGDVAYDPDTKTTSLYYVEKDMLKTTFTTYHFDENLGFIDEEIKSFYFGEGGPEAIEEARSLFEWFDYRGESYTTEHIDIGYNLRGRLMARKQRVTYNFNWFFGAYFPKFEKAEKVEIKGQADEKIYLYDYVVNTESGASYLLVGIKAPKGEKDRFRHTRNFQLVKLTENLELEYLEEISFDYGMAISFNHIQYMEELGEGEEIVPNDVHNGKLYLIFSPVKSILNKKFTNPNAGDNTLIIMDENGKIETKVNYMTETTGWVVEDMVVAGNGDLYFYGPAKDDAYINSVMPTNSPLTGRTEVKDIKWKNFQVMKVANNEFQWVSSTDLKEFKTKAIAPPSQKQMPIYSGKKFEKSMAYVTPNGELFIGGQNYTTKNVPDPNAISEDATIKVVDNYKDLVMFHFGEQGKLKSAYGVRRDKMNKFSKANLTPQDVYVTPDGSSLYWVYGEIKGMRRGLEITGGALEMAGVSTLSKRKLLYYPTVAKIDLKSGKVGDFVPLGTDSEGKQKYFTNPNFPQLLASDGSNLTFVGEDKKGSLIWLGRVNVE